MKKAISIILVIIWMIIVFLFSSQIGDDSQVTSGNTIRKIIIFFNENISNSKLEEIVEFLQPFIRKVAHFTLYTLGGIVIFNMFNCFKLQNNKKIIYSFLTGTLYASTDEIHQLFVPGRSGMIKDVLIDSFGIIIGIFICVVVAKLFKVMFSKKYNDVMMYKILSLHKLGGKKVMNLEDLKKIYKLIDLSNKYSRADRFDFDLYKLKSIIDFLKPKLANGVICLAVNDILSDVNNFYKTNFVCVKDDEYASVINEVREYIKNKFNNEIKTELVIELAKLLNNNDFKS